MRRLELVTGAFRRGTSRAESHAILRSLLEALVTLNVDYLKRHPRTPALYRSGVRYRREPARTEEWRTIPIVRAQGFGDCEDLAAWRIAELRELGIPAKPCFRYRQEGNKRIYHIMVCLPDGTGEDPSRVLGMNWAEEEV